MAGYQYAYQQAEGTAVQTHTQEAMEVGVFASAAGNEGIKRKREEANVGVKDSLPKRAKAVEEPAYLPPVPVTALPPGGIKTQAQPVEPFKR